MENIKVYCIIVTYNGMKWIDKCLMSLRASSLRVFPVVIDNCSNDETVNHIKQYYPEVSLLVNDENKGFGQANNQGLEYAYKEGGTHFFLLNQDAWVYEDTIFLLVQMQCKYNLAIASPVHLNGKGDFLDHNYFVYSVIDVENNSYISDLILDKLKPYYYVSMINAAAWMLSKTTLEEVGGFDPIFFHYGEDSNYCNRLRYHNKNIAFIPKSFINHDREIKGNIKVFKKNSITSKLFNEYGNINKKFWRIDALRIKIHLHHVFLAVSFFVKLKFKDLYDLILSYLKVIYRVPIILKHRKINKCVSNNWINVK